MLGTFLSLIVAVFYFRGWIYLSETEYFALLTSTSFFSIFLIFYSLKGTLKGLLKGSKMGNPFSFTLYKENKLTLIAPVLSLSLFFFSLFFAAFFSYSDFLFPIWIVMLGLFFDALFYNYHFLSGFLDPLQSIEKMQQRGFSHLKRGLFFDFCEDINALYGIALRGIEENRVVEVQHAVQVIQKGLEKALEKGGEEAAFSIVFILERLVSLFEKGEKQGLTPLSFFFVGAFGKVFQTVVKGEKENEISLLPIALGVYAPLIRDKNIDWTERLIEQSITSLQEAIKVLIREGLLTQKDIRDSFYSALGVLKELLDKLFLKNKKRAISDLKAPLLNLKTILEQKEVESLFCRTNLVAALNSLLLEIETLDAVMRTMPKRDTALPKEDRLEEGVSGESPLL